MRQTLHLFRKDLREFWIETLLSVSVTLAAGWTDRFLWIPDPYDTMPFAWRVAHDPLKLLAYTFVILMPLTWAFLIERIVHAESLIGDRQFWITRPIDWKSLLSAKLLFLLVFLYLPFTIAECIEIKRAGFPILPSLPGLLFLLLLISGILIVPLLTLAALTKNFARMILTLLGLILAVAALAYLANKVDTNSVSTPYSDRFSIPVLLVIASCAIVFQYARRKTWLARTMLLPIPLIIAALALYMPNSSMVESAYPHPDHFSVASIHLSPAPGELMRGGDSDDDPLELILPMTAEGVAPGRAVLVDNIVASFDDVSWTSDWQATYNHNFLPGGYRSDFSVHVKRKDYERFRSAPHTMKLRFALTEVKAGHVTTIANPNQPFSVPLLGNCAPSAFSRFRLDELLCRSALHGPDLTFIATTATTTSCDDASPDSTVLLVDWQGSLNNDPAEFGLTSTWNHPIYLQSQTRDSDRNVKVTPCPNRPITFTHYSLVRRTQTELTLPSFQFPALTNGLSNIVIQPAN